MWSALTQAITRDLSEFASVVGSDAAELLNNAATGGILQSRRSVAGDEDYPEVQAILEMQLDEQGDEEDDINEETALHHDGVAGESGRGGGGGEVGRGGGGMTVTTVQQLQSNLDTFRVPLSAEDEALFAQWPNFERAMDRDRWRMLLTESAEIQDAYEECVDCEEPCCTDEEFFSRYFWRLSQLRAATLCSAHAARRRALVNRRRAAKQSSSRGNSNQVGAFNDSGGAADVLKGWNDEDDDDNNNTTTDAHEEGEGEEHEHESNTIRATDTYKIEALVLRKKVADMDRELRQLREENARLKGMLLVGAVGEADRDHAPPSAVNTALVEPPPPVAAQTAASSSSSSSMVVVGSSSDDSLQPDHSASRLALAAAAHRAHNDDSATNPAAAAAANDNDDEDDDDWTKLT